MPSDTMSGYDTMSEEPSSRAMAPQPTRVPRACHSQPHSRVAHGHGLAGVARAELRDGAVLQVDMVEKRRGCKRREA